MFICYAHLHLLITCTKFHFNQSKTMEIVCFNKSILRAAWTFASTPMRTPGWKKSIFKLYCFYYIMLKTAKTALKLMSQLVKAVFNFVQNLKLLARKMWSLFPCPSTLQIASRSVWKHFSPGK